MVFRGRMQLKRSMSWVNIRAGCLKERKQCLGMRVNWRLCYQAILAESCIYGDLIAGLNLRERRHWVGNHMDLVSGRLFLRTVK
jgi:hypothetical protein